jgi:oxygen-independent coproporphyrinogen-3 oxidase
MRQLFETLRGEFEVAPGAEITLECAPGQLGGETLDELLRQGMNRVSFGVQSFVDLEAAAVGRLHTREMCLAEIERMRGVGIENINVDLIVGLPHQTRESWRESVEVALGSRVPHVSVYMLEVDEDSRLGREMLGAGSRYSAGDVPSEDETAEWYGAACGWLDDAGIRQYEISNFARAGHASRHNVKYWRREAYLGFGLDAHSMLRTRDGAVRRANTADLDGYLADDVDVFGLRGSGEPTVEVIGREQGFEETLFLGLRMNAGVELERLRAEFGDGLADGALQAMVDVVEAGLVEVEGGRLRLTGAGRMVSNEVFSRLLVGVEV